MRHSSPITRYSSKTPITRYSSNVTRQNSHVTRHTSHVTRRACDECRHTSHVTRHTRHTSLVTSHASHVIVYCSLVILYCAALPTHKNAETPCAMPLHAAHTVCRALRESGGQRTARYAAPMHFDLNAINSVNRYWVVLR